MAEPSIQAVYEQNRKDVYRYLLSLTHDVHLSEDLTSETFLGAIKSLPQFKGQSDIKTWLFSIARYKWYEHLRKNKRELAEELMERYLMGDGEDPEAIAVGNERARRIHFYLEQETELKRNVVIMRIQGYSFHEIARKCHISESSARVLEYRTKNKIKALLGEEGLD